MAQGDIETYYEEGTWKNKREGTDRAFTTGGTKAEATAQGREAAMKDKVEHIIRTRTEPLPRKTATATIRGTSPARALPTRDAGMALRFSPAPVPGSLSDSVVTLSLVLMIPPRFQDASTKEETPSGLLLLLLDSGQH